MVRFRQGPDAVEMVRQDNDGVDAQGVAFLHPFEGIAQHIDRGLLGQNRFALMGNHGEEITASRKVMAPVMHVNPVFSIHELTSIGAMKGANEKGWAQPSVSNTLAVYVGLACKT